MEHSSERGRSITACKLGLSVRRAAQLAESAPPASDYDSGSKPMAVSRVARFEGRLCVEAKDPARSKE